MSFFTASSKYQVWDLLFAKMSSKRKVSVLVDAEFIDVAADLEEEEG